MVTNSTINRKFSPFVISVYGMLDNDALVVPVNSSRLMEEKMDENISHLHGWINGRIEIAVTMSYL